MVGMIGRYLKRVSNGNVVVPRIYALDPAGKCFSLFSKSLNLK